MNDLFKNKKVKAIFFDIDGTLLGSSHSPSMRLINAIDGIKEKNINVSFATGRPFFGCKHLINTFGCDNSSLFFAGSLLYNIAQERVIASYTLSYELTKKLIRLAETHGIYSEIYTQDEYYCEAVNENTAIHASYLEVSAKGVGNLCDYVDYLETQKRGIYKLGLIATSEKLLILSQDELATSSELVYGQAIGALHENVAFGNFTSSLADRKIGFKTLCDDMKVDPSHTVAFGDSPSDIPFLSLAGIGVAMGGANEEVCSVADIVTKNADEDGVAEVLENILKYYE
jgi:5-amino-6-(5-phospho-D-ribitylamino)uracil phosphatase